MIFQCFPSKLIFSESQYAFISLRADNRRFKRSSLRKQMLSVELCRCDLGTVERWIFLALVCRGQQRTCHLPTAQDEPSELQIRHAAREYCIWIALDIGDDKLHSRLQ